MSISNTEPTFSSLIYDLSLSSSDISLFTFMQLVLYCSILSLLSHVRVLLLLAYYRYGSDISDIYLQYLRDRVFLRRWDMQQFVISLFSRRISFSSWPLQSISSPGPFSSVFSLVVARHADSSMAFTCIVSTYTYLCGYPVAVDFIPVPIGGVAFQQYIVISVPQQLAPSVSSHFVSSHFIFVCHSQFRSPVFSNASLVYDSCP